MRHAEKDHFRSGGIPANEMPDRQGGKFLRQGKYREPAALKIEK